MSASQVSPLGTPSPASAFLLSLVIAVPAAAVVAVAYILNWGR